MIEGITILNETLKFTKNIVALVILLFFVGLILIIACILNTGVIVAKGIKSPAGIVWCSILTVGILSIVASIIIENVLVPSVPYYEVTISNDVDLVEFLDNYEIIGKRGEIYTIKPIEKE